MSGLNAWLLQRVSAIYLAGFFIYFIVVLLLCTPLSYADWHDWMSSTSMTLATTVFFLALLTHAWVGMRDVLIDYVKPCAVRLSLLTLLGLAIVVMAIAVVRILLTVGV